MLVLCSNGADVAFLIVCIFLRRWTGIDAAVSAIVADVVYGGVFDPSVIGVVNVHVAYAIHRSVVVELVVFPAAPFVPVTTISEPVIDPSIKTDVRAPITFMEEKRVVTPTPIARESIGSQLQELRPKCRAPSNIRFRPKPNNRASRCSHPRGR